MKSQTLSERCAVAICCSLFFLAGNARAEPSDPVYFDAPALAIAREVVPDVPLLPDEKMVEIVLPVSSQIQFAARNHIQEFRFDVSWNRMIYPLVDYGPRTRTTTSIDGTIEVETQNSFDSDLGFNISASPAGVATGNVRAQIGGKTAGSQRYSEIPQHEVLVASGTIHRGTGAFFRFHPSTTETLEGGRDLVVAYRVPRNWRGGLLTIECRAAGQRQILGSWTEPVESARSFVVAVYQDGDDQARQVATGFVRRELILQQRWRNGAESRSRTEVQRIFRPAAFQSDRRQDVSLPGNWVDQLVHSGSDDVFLRYESAMSPGLHADASAFIEARRNLVQLSR